MKSIYIFNLFFLAFQSVMAQNNEVKVNAHKVIDGIIFYAINDTDVRQEIALTILPKNLSGYHSPITKMIASKDSTKMIKLFFLEGEKWSYRTNYTYVSKPTELEIKLQNQKKKQELFNLFDTKNNPVIFFYKEGCPRSEYAKKMLDRKKISYKYINTSNNQEDLKAMFKLLKLQSPGMNKVLYPIFLIDGRLNHDIANLRLYLKELASKY